MKARLWPVTVLLFLSGMCALVFQVAWMREFRLVFGATTAATAAVLAIFMGGLGLGNALLGKKADRHANPIRLYAWLLAGIAVSVAVSPLLVDLARAIYVALGGQLVLGMAGATGVRLLLSTVVLGFPTVLMGGTLPAAVKAVTTAGDTRRRGAGILYGVNTLGAVAGAALCTFALLPRLGTRTTLWLACLVNLLTALAAWMLSRLGGQAEPSAAPAGEAASRQQGGEAPEEEPSARAEGPPVSPAPVYAAAGVVGFAFFLMELVWYRMLVPILGGTTYTFGLILAVALLGIGLGGAAYPLVFRFVRPTLRAFVLCCGLEAVCIAFPYALGDRLAILAAVLLGVSSGFYIAVLGWTLVAAIVVLPAAVVGGVQFPLLIALAGRGEREVGKQLGLTFAWNTAGAILGSLAGGFGLLPILSAPGTWCAVVVLLAILALVALVASHVKERDPLRLLVPAGVVAVALLLCTAKGPTAVWRHSNIGNNRSHMPSLTARNELRRWSHYHRRIVVREVEGIEAGVAVVNANGYALNVNGMGDGHAFTDAPTSLTLGLVGALLHPDPKKALVVGMGTGETAGWLAEVPSLQRLDLVEMEPAVDEVARRCAPINHNLLEHPKVRRIYNDGREVLLTIPDRYDLIVSAPSHPHRAGVANLFTEEFYQAVRNRLSQRGLFCQWLQAYEVDVRTVVDVLATVHSVFPYVEIWETQPNDLLLLCSTDPISYPVPRLRKRLQEEPFKSCMAFAWRVNDLEGVLARYVAGPELANDMVRRGYGRVNTDDHNRVEYGFARTLGQKNPFSSLSMRVTAGELGVQDPPVVDGTVDWELVANHRQVMTVTHGYDKFVTRPTEEQKLRAEVLRKVCEFHFEEAVESWKVKPYELVFPCEVELLAYACASINDERADALLDQLREFDPVEVDCLRSLQLSAQGKTREAAAAAEAAMIGLRTNPWVPNLVGKATLFTAATLASRAPALAPQLYAAIRLPFAGRAFDRPRRLAACDIAQVLGDDVLARLLETYEPYVPWTEPFLRGRLAAYVATGHPLAAQAASDLEQFKRYALP